MRIYQPTEIKSGHAEFISASPGVRHNMQGILKQVQDDEAFVIVKNIVSWKH